MPEKRIYAARREMPVAFQENYFNNGSAYFADIDAAGMPAPGKTATARYTDERYIKTFMRTGNKKLTDVYDAETRERIAAYAQFNLPARRTCPNATKACFKFCYAIRDERFPTPRENRRANYDASRRDDFVERMIYTIETNLATPRYHNAVMILRIHESGDFYSKEYMQKWIRVISHFIGRNVIFQFYTKCFDFVLSLDPISKAVLRLALTRHNVAMSLSIDESTPARDFKKIKQIRAEFPNVNIYFAIDGAKLDGIQYDNKCTCENCAKCAHCTFTAGKTTAVAIH